MDKKSLQKIIKSSLNTFAKENGFLFQKPGLMLRKHQDTLHIINFDVLNERFNCDVAIMPLYYPSETIDLSFGNRLNHFKTKHSGIWGGGTLQDVEQDLQHVKVLLEQNILQWFEEVGNPNGIVTFIENGSSEDINIIVGFPPVIRNTYLGISYLYTNNIEKAYSPLKKVLETYKDDDREWAVYHKELVEELLSMMSEQPHMINNKLQEFIAYSKEKMKLSKI